MFHWEKNWNLFIVILLDAVKAVGSEAETIPWHNLINVMSTEVRIHTKNLRRQFWDWAQFDITCDGHDNKFGDNQKPWRCYRET